MSILIDNDTRVLIQTYSSSRTIGGEAAFHAAQMMEYGTQVVGIVNADKGGQSHEGIPVFNSVSEAVRKTGANSTANFVPATTKSS